MQIKKTKTDVLTKTELSVCFSQRIGSSILLLFSPLQMYIVNVTRNTMFSVLGY